MKRNLFIFVLILSQLSFTSHNDIPAGKKNKQVPPACPPPQSEIKPDVVKTRTDIYAAKKQASNQMYLRDEIPYTPEAIDQLLKYVSDPSAHYDGFRVYFACYPYMLTGPKSTADSGLQYVRKEELGMMTLIFVPTRADPSKGKHYHGDDLKNCWTINGKSVQVIPSSIASLWIKKAEKTYLLKFETIPITSIHKFKEAHSLWYSNKLIVPSGNTVGILKYLECQIKNHLIDAVYVKLGGFNLFSAPLFKNYHNKLTLIFNFHSTKVVDNDFESFFILDFSSEFKKMNSFTDNSTDTGKPCPPPTDCSTNGALLPQ